jgi:hypothetical protein
MIMSLIVDVEFESYEQRCDTEVRPVSGQGALCQGVTRDAEVADFQAIDSAILAIEKEAKRLDSMKTWTETIANNGGKILDEIRKMSAALERQIEILGDAVSGLKQSTVQES